MPRDVTYHDYVVYDLLGHLPSITSRAMFGGWGLYLNGVFFAIITGGELYFKTSEDDKTELKKLGSHPFIYKKKAREATLKNYWLITEEILENREELEHWVDKAVVASAKGPHRV